MLCDVIKSTFFKMSSPQKHTCSESAALNEVTKQFQENVRSETQMSRQLSHFSDMQNDALMHREGLKV